MTKVRLTIALPVILVVFTGAALADPYPDQILKFSQLPLDGALGIPGATGGYYGHDEPSTAYLVGSSTLGGPEYSGWAMADDFADKRIPNLPRQPVVHVRWWGSYIHNQIREPVDKFLIAFESDVPAGTEAGSFSHPGDVLLTQIVHRDPAGGSPPPGAFTEKLISPGGPPLSEGLYEYNAELHLDKWFPEEPDTVYWLKIVALVDAPPPTPTDLQTVWGWHNRDYTVHNPLASVPPAVVPGESIIGAVPGPDGSDVDVWHFQDDAVTSLVRVLVRPDNPDMPDVEQTEYVPMHYIDDIDGPPGIGEYSKDLAFELYTVPEPTSLAALALGGLLAIVRKAKR